MTFVAPGRRREAWEKRTRGLQGAALARAAAAFLQERGDAALGLAPAALLSARRREAWLLFWCAARLVDDAVEAGRTDVETWRRALRRDEAATFAERCVQAFLSHPAVDDPGRARRLLFRGLMGLEAEALFGRPRPMVEYLALIEYKSVPAMQILNPLLFPGESTRRLDAHANLFAVSAQLGDDCRDVHADRARGKVFVTLEELRERPLDVFVEGEEFVEGRNRMCARFLREADAAAGRFQRPTNRRRAAALSAIWAHALETGQVRPSRKPLRLPPTRP